MWIRNKNTEFNCYGDTDKIVVYVRAALSQEPPPSKWVAAPPLRHRLVLQQLSRIMGGSI